MNIVGGNNHTSSSIAFPITNSITASQITLVTGQSSASLAERVIWSLNWMLQITLTGAPTGTLFSMSWGIPSDVALPAQVSYFAAGNGNAVQSASGATIITGAGTLATILTGSMSGASTLAPSANLEMSTFILTNDYSVLSGAWYYNFTWDYNVIG